MISDRRRRPYGKRSVVILWIEVAAAPSNNTRVSRLRLSPVSVAVVLPWASVDDETELMVGPAVGTTVKADGRT